MGLGARQGPFGLREPNPHSGEGPGLMKMGAGVPQPLTPAPSPGVSFGHVLQTVMSALGEGPEHTRQLDPGTVVSGGTVATGRRNVYGSPRGPGTGSERSGGGMYL